MRASRPCWAEGLSRAGTCEKGRGASHLHRRIERAQQQQPLLLLFPQPQLFPQLPQPKRIRMMIRISHTQEQSLLLHIYISPHLSCSALSYAGKCKWGPDRRKNF